VLSDKTLRCSASKTSETETSLKSDSSSIFHNENLIAFENLQNNKTLLSKPKPNLFGVPQFKEENMYNHFGSFSTTTNSITSGFSDQSLQYSLFHEIPRPVTIAKALEPVSVDKSHLRFS
jgi:hypothetical protein